MVLVGDVWDKGMETDSFFGWKMVSLATVILSVASFMLLYGLLPLFTPGAGKLSQRISAAVYGWYVAGGLLLVCLASLPYLFYVDLLGNNSLVQAAGLQHVQALAFRSLKFCDDPACKESDKPVTGIVIGKTVDTAIPSIGYTQNISIPINPVAIPLLEQFVAGPGQHSVLRKAAVMGGLEIYRVLEQPRMANALEKKYLMEGILNHTDTLHNARQLGLLSGSLPVDSDMRAQLNHLSDDKLFYAGARASALLATAWARFGDMERANHFLDRARKLNPEKYTKLTLQPSTLLNGSVNGKVELKGHDVTGLRVTLWRKSKDIDRDYSSLRISDSFDLQADGSFKFNNLTDGEYFVGLQLPLSVVSEKDILTGKNIPNRIVLDKAHPKHDVGLIQLVANK